MRRSIIARAAMFGTLWWILTAGEHNGWGVGGVTIVLAMAVSLMMSPLGAHRFSIMRLPGFLAFFLFQSIIGGLQVAAIAIRPRLDLQPAMLEIHLRLPEEAARVFLVSTLNLLPGTLSAGLDANRLLLHVLDRRRPIEQEVRQAEARVARLFRTDLL